MERIYEEGSAQADWEREQQSESRYQREVYSDNQLWEDHQENWVEITEFVGLKKPAGIQLGLPFEEVA